MNNTTRSFAAALFGLTLVAASPVLAHHSHAMFDDAKETTVTGTVATVRYANPHVYLFIEGTEEGAEARMWAVEMSHVGNMMNRGVTATTIKPGDTIVISFNPLRNGEAGGNYTRIISINDVMNTAEGNSWAVATN